MTDEEKCQYRYTYHIVEEVVTDRPLTEDEVYEHLRDIIEKKKFLVVSTTLPFSIVEKEVDSLDS